MKLSALEHVYGASRARIPRQVDVETVKPCMGLPLPLTTYLPRLLQRLHIIVRLFLRKIRLVGMANHELETSPLPMGFEEHQVVEAPEIPSAFTRVQDPEQRPSCFKSTIQEWLFILTATMSIGTSSFLYGICAVITVPIGRTLSMTPSEITWISASSACVHTLC